MRVRSAWIVVGAAAMLGGTLATARVDASEIFENVRVTSGAILDVDPSTRSMGMGGASTAVFWGEAPNDWANPALLGTARGMRYTTSDVDLLPQFSPKFEFKTRRLTLGAGGIGLSLVGEPFDGLGEQRLEYGVYVTDGNPLGGTTIIFPKESERSWGAGVSIARGLESLAQWRGHDAPAWTRRGDVAFGLNRKAITDNTFDPADPQHVVAYDWGALARTSVPVHRMLGTIPGAFELAYAFAVTNANDATLYSTPTARQHRNGGALRASIDAPPSVSEGLPAWLAPGVTSLVALGIAYDVSHITAGGRDSRGWSMNSWGAELSLGGLLFARVGGAHNSGTSSTNNTWGLGAVLPIGHWGAVHYDYARVNRPAGGRITPQSWAVVVDPVAMVRGIK